MARFYDPFSKNIGFNDGSIQSYSPVWSGDGLTYTGTPTTGFYVKVGKVVTVQIEVECASTTNFGTGQYSLTLPFQSKFHTDVYGGSIHKITNQGIDHYSIKGHLSANSSTFTLWDLASASQDEIFDHNSPVILDTNDRFHMSFTYIIV